MNETKTQLTVILDSIGRTIVGRQKDSTSSTVSLENPSIVVVQPNPSTNQIQLQLLPLFFKEFLADRTQPLIWTFNKNQITQSNDLVLGDQFINQYEGMWKTFIPPADQAEGESVIKLFEE